MREPDIVHVPIGHPACGLWKPLFDERSMLGFLQRDD